MSRPMNGWDLSEALARGVNHVNGRDDRNEDGRCPMCGNEIVVGSWPFCPHGHASMKVIPDEVPGGFTVENGFDQPTTFYSRSAHREALAARGLEMRVRWAGPLDKHVSRWDAVDEYTLNAAKSLVERTR